MRSSLLEMKIRQISELKRDSVYVLKMTKILEQREGQWLNNYLNQIYKMTGCVFIVLGPDAEIISTPDNNQIEIIGGIVEDVLKKHGVIDPRSKNGIIV